MFMNRTKKIKYNKCKWKCYTDSTNFECCKNRIKYFINVIYFSKLFLKQLLIIFGRTK